MHLIDRQMAMALRNARDAGPSESAPGIAGKAASLVPAGGSAAGGARGTAGRLPESPCLPPSANFSCTVSPAPGVAARPGNLTDGEEALHAILQESAPLHRACEDVRRLSKTEFVTRRADLEKDPDFKPAYDAYRRWRDCDAKDPQYDAIAAEGKIAQQRIMHLSGAATDGQSLFALLSRQDSKLLRFVSPISGDFRAPQVGLMAGLRFDEHGQPILAFPGTGSGVMIRSQWRTNIQQFLGIGGPPAAHLLAAELAGHLKDLLKDSGELAITGHSLGGGIASFAAATIDARCHAYNPAALGGACRRHLARHYPSNLAQASEKQHVIRVKYDQVSSPAMQRRLAAAISYWAPGFETPTHLGKVHVIPRERLKEKHRGLLGLHTMRAFKNVLKKAFGRPPAQKPAP